MFNFIYPNIRTNPDYKFDEVLSGYNYNFTLLENSINPSGLTINGNLIVTGSSLLNSVSATTISATTFYGDGSNLTGIPQLWTDGGNTSLYPTGFGSTTSTGFGSITAAYNSLASSFYGSIWGGLGHTNSAYYAAIVGGLSNTISSTASNNYGFIGGGRINVISGTARHGVILGGESNQLTAGNHSAIVGGVSSTISNQGSFIGGGSNHTISWNYSGLIGGRYNTIHALYSFQGGSYSSDITGWYAGIIGGIDNNVTGYYSGIFGGRNNTVTHTNSIALGGSGLTSTADDTVYVPYLNVGLINTGSSVDILTIDNNGNILTNPDLIINNFYTTGVTLNGYIASFDRNDSLSAYTLDLSSLSGIPDTNTFVTGFTYNENKFEITDNNGGIFDATINTMTGLTVSGNLSATTFYGDGSQLTGISSDFTGGTVIGETNFTGGASVNTLSAITFSASTIYSGNTNLYDIFLTSADGNDITRIQPGININTGGTENNPIINLDDNIIISSISASTISGATLNLNSLSSTTTATTYNNLVIDSGGNVMKNNQFYIGVNFESTGVTWNYVAPESFKIFSIDNPSVITYDLLHNGTAYTFGNGIALYDDVSITGVISTGFLKLNSELL